MVTYVVEEEVVAEVDTVTNLLDEEAVAEEGDCRLLIQDST